MKPYYSDESTTLYLGKCEDVLPTLEPVDHVITDPPYSEHVHKSVRGNDSLDGKYQKWHTAKPRKIDLGFDHLSSELRLVCAEQFARLARRWVLVFSDVESASDWRDDLAATGLDYVRTGAWVKIGGAPQFSGDRPAVGFEAVTIMHPKGRKRWNGGGKPAIWSVPIANDRGGPQDEPRLHTAQKPLGLMRALVDQFTDPGETILDAFGGSATTAVAAAYLGRRSILIEEDEERAKVAAKRLQSAQDTLFGGVA